MRRASNPAAYLFAGPALVLIGSFSFVAIAYSLWISLHDYDILAKHNLFVGLANYRGVLADDLFRKSLLNTSYYVLMSVPSIMCGALSLALLADKAGRGSPVVKVIYFIPSITPAVVVSLLWVWLLRDDGALNQCLGLLGIHGPNWLQNPRSAMPAIVIVATWQAVGYYMDHLHGGPQRHPEDVLRGRDHRRRRRAGPVLACHRAAVAQHFRLRDGHADHRVVSSVHVGLHHDQRRPSKRYRSGPGASLPQRVPIRRQDGLRGRDGVGPLWHYRVLHRDPDEVHAVPEAL